MSSETEQTDLLSNTRPHTEEILKRMESKLYRKGIQFQRGRIKKTSLSSHLRQKINKIHETMVFKTLSTVKDSDP